MRYPTDRPTDRQTDTASYRGALSHLKRMERRWEQSSKNGQKNQREENRAERNQPKENQHVEILHEENQHEVTSLIAAEKL